MKMESYPKICIIGAGFSGLCAAIKLKTKLNITSFVIFEACDDVGGTWFVNTYPGCACDVPSHLYSFSFAPKYDWTQSYSSQPEILEYTKDVTRKYDIYKHIRFNTRIESLRWDEKRNKWIVSILDTKFQKIESSDFDIVINGTGKIRIPHYPEEYIGFKGPLMHTAEWDHSVSLEGKRVGIVGTGSSAVQVITAIASKVKTLTVFQRKAPYIVPRPQWDYSKAAKWAFAHIPGFYKFSRYFQFWLLESMYTGTIHNSMMNKFANNVATWFRNHQIKDEAMRIATTPTYQVVCKRIIVSENYYKTLLQPNVELVTSPIIDVKNSVIYTEDGSKIDLDVLILATGYQPHDFFAPMKVYGKNGEDILEEWQKTRPRGFLGICSHKVPNFFTLLGPYSALGHNSNLYTIECQVHWMILAIKMMLSKNAKYMEITEEAEDKFMDFIDDKFKATVWGNEQCGSWYLDSRGQNTTLWPHHQLSYWKWCNDIKPEYFHLKHK